MSNVLDLYRGKGFTARNEAGTNGGEWAGPCPVCGGRDRFRIWPEQIDTRGQRSGSYWCRQCEIAGDAIQFLIDVEGMGFKEAAQECGVELKDRPPGDFHRPQRRQQVWQGKDNKAPGSLWQQKARGFVDWCSAQLTGHPDVLDWLADRGITELTAKEFRLGWNPGETTYGTFRPRKSWGLPPRVVDGKEKKLWLPIGLVIPVFDGDELLRVRVRRPEGEPKYYRLPSDSGWSGPMVTTPDRQAFVVVEAELDALAIHQAAGDLVSAVAVGSSSAKPDAATHERLQRACKILVALDLDEAGERAWKWWRRYPKAVRWNVPQGKDPGDFAGSGGDLRAWVMAGLPPSMTLETMPLDQQVEGGGGESSQVEAVEKAAAQEPVVPGAVRRLAALMRSAGVEVEVRGDGGLGWVRSVRWLRWTQARPAEFAEANALLWDGCLEWVAGFEGVVDCKRILEVASCRG